MIRCTLAVLCMCVDDCTDPSNLLKMILIFRSIKKRRESEKSFCFDHDKKNGRTRLICRGVDVSASLRTTTRTPHIHLVTRTPTTTSFIPSPTRLVLHPVTLSIQTTSLRFLCPLSYPPSVRVSNQTSRNRTLHLKETHREKSRRGRSVVRIARSRL